MEIEQIAVGEIKPYDKNQRIHSPEQIIKIKKSIEEFGMIQPLVVDMGKNIIIGHARFEAAKKAGLTRVPCVIASTLTEKQVKMLRVADNKLNELSYFDTALLKEELNELLNEPDFDLDILGFSTDEFNEILSSASAMDYLLDDEDDEPEENDEPEEDVKPARKTDDGYASFEVVMKAENKSILYEAIEVAMAVKGLMSIEDGLREIAEAYLELEAVKRDK